MKKNLKYALPILVFVVIAASAFTLIGENNEFSWGTIKAFNDKITPIKQADLLEAIDKPMMYSINGKPTTIESATINIFPPSKEPLQLDVIGSQLSQSLQDSVRSRMEWGCKIFIENLVIKGKSKKIPPIMFKLQ